MGAKPSRFSRHTRNQDNQAEASEETEPQHSPAHDSKSRVPVVVSKPKPPPKPLQMPNATVPCQYRTGKTLGSGTYAIVKEAIHIKTGKYYACKVINKKLMEGREHMVRNEIAVLKRISSGNPNIVTLHDYFETSHNLYLCFDLCTGGELFDRICAKGNYYEADAASLVRTIFTAVKYIHSAGIVHRDLKPENLLFRTPAEDADIMIADFGLSRIMEEEKLSLLTEICGTPGYMAPEIFLKSGHSKPVDVWAMGVVTYFLLAGYTPFDRDTPKLEMEAIIAGDYKFEPEEYWANVSDTARDFVRACLTIDPEKRPTADECLGHKWLASTTPHFVSTPSGGPTDLLPHVKKAFNAKLAWKKAAFSIKALHRMTLLASGQHPLGKEAAELSESVRQYKEESAQEVMEDASIMHHHNLQHPSESSGNDPTSPSTKEVADKLAETRLA
ncbi:Pkinase-domain-containing protein [Mycena sanguinolenta]|uniref:Pkinase-domain-containing protein n=1 Tax=Mycena sanguinolenta TaxID=230812 RepID=A0A8H6YYW1_9AGAR|nr:Pkinase-domain-containing protein [Mycena sanguinolenta]